ncbi:MAG: hypothetical protein R3Y35_10925 [Clostridia bacterium]
MRIELNNTEKDNILQGEFTKYVVKSIKREKWRYIQKQNQILNHESYLEDENYIVTQSRGIHEDVDASFFITPENFDDIANLLSHDKLLYTYINLSEKEKKILFLKVFKEFTFKEISNILDLDFNVVQTTYYRVIEKFRKGWNK